MEALNREDSLTCLPSGTHGARSQLPDRLLKLNELPGSYRVACTAPRAEARAAFSDGLRVLSSDLPGSFIQAFFRKAPMRFGHSARACAASSATTSAPTPEFPRERHGSAGPIGATRAGRRDCDCAGGDQLGARQPLRQRLAARRAGHFLRTLQAGAPSSGLQSPP